MPFLPNPELYALFERIVREMLSTATGVIVQFVPGDGSTCKFLRPSEFDQIPWGQYGAIGTVSWFPAGDVDNTDRWNVMIQERDGNTIGVEINAPGYYRTRMVYIDVNGNWLHTRRDITRIKCQSEDEAVEAVRKLVTDFLEEYEAELASTS